MTFTKEQLQHIIETDHVQCGDASALARMALAGMEAEPVAWAHRLINKRNGVVHPWVYGSAEACPSEGDIFNIEVMPLYTAPPAPVALPSGYSDFEEIWSSSTHPLTQDDEMKDFAWDIWNACRAAMLQGAEPVSNRDELPLDYLQGHKDGLEWAAQLAEANHPQTGDWLYDDPIALAAAIRKGPDMPELKSASADEDDNFYSWFGRFWLENYQQNNYTTSAKQMLGTIAEFTFRAGRESATQAGNSPVIPDGWVACSERMPEPKRWLALYGSRVFTHGDERGQPYHKSCVDQGYLGSDGQFYLLNWDQPGTLDDNYNNDLAIATHWMYWELPAPPQQEVKP